MLVQCLVKGYSLEKAQTENLLILIDELGHGTRYGCLGMECCSTYFLYIHMYL
uniref:Uncharacterized protein n=1 Tax=Amphimedon queenslandica TaxID=400682 RepID=A0A1X7TC13_AMPQE